MITVYVLKGITGKRYVGITNDLDRRLSEHRSGNTKGGQLLKSFNVLLAEKYPDYHQARLREQFLKTGRGRAFLNELESRTGPAKGG